jgi:NAD(P)-dependent dehydrogenase (short-subunit alcohol dehydrogenase family)
MTDKAKTVQELSSLNGKVAVVTGGSGLFGRQITEALAEAGARTIMASRNLEKLLAQAGLFRKAGLEVDVLRYDQSSDESCQQLLQQSLDLAGSVDVLVNNSVLRTMKGWDDPAANFAQSMEINATGLFVMTRLFGDYMATQGHGSIINIGSIQGMMGPDFTLYEGLNWGAPADYFFHKGGLLQLTKYAASVLGPRGVRVNALSPGGFFTNQDARFVKRYYARTFLGRMANETDIKGGIVYLASDASAYVTGANIVIDGGYTCK